MSRLRRAAHGVAASYVQLVAAALFTLASVPLALHYLDKERFGLWALMGTLSGYLSLVDAGMSGAAGRLLIDHKDDRAGGGYGSMIKTSVLVSLVQAALILLAGVLLAPTFARLLEVPTTLQPEFLQLVRWQSAALALGFAARVLSMMLTAHQRMDWWNYSGVVALLAGFAGQWLMFYFGFGVLSLAGGSLSGTILSVAVQAAVCKKLNLFPEPGGWGAPSWKLFKEIFSYGKDMFLVSVGTQLITSSQIIVITRLLGLEAAATWSVGLRVFNLVSQVIWKIPQMSMAALAEMLARGETARLRDRYRSLAMLTFSFSGWVAVSFAVCNSRFITIWTHGKIAWPPGNDWLLAAWMIILTVQHCHNSFLMMTKQIGFMRYVYFVEGVVFVALSCLAARWGGLAAIIGCSILCSTCFSGTYGIWRVSRLFDLSIRKVAWNWLRPMSLVLLFYLPVALLAWWIPILFTASVQLGIAAILAGPVGALLFLRYGLPVSFRAELLRRVPASVSAILGKILSQPQKVIL